MNAIEHLRELFVYNEWANKLIVASLKQNSCESARKILAHLLITEKEYFRRLHGRDSTGFDFWQNLSLEECDELVSKIASDYNGFLQKLREEDLDTQAEYKTSRGVSHVNDWRELLTHVLLHSSTHRGNIVIKLREEGFVPPKIDYIIYLRETKLI